MVFTTRCPQCGKILWFASNLAGKLTICPACGTVMKLTPPPEAEQAPPPPPPEDVIPFAKEAAPEAASETPPQTAPSDQPAPTSPFDQIGTQPDDQVPTVVEESYLTHRAAAEVGEVQVEPSSADTAEWEAQQSQTPPVPPVTPPVWAPTPLSGIVPSAPPPTQELVWIPSASSRIDSLMRRAPARTPEEEEHRRRTIIWSAGATLVVLMILGVLWLLRGQQAPITWEQMHRDDILTLKDDAENLALTGHQQQAYEKYQELEHLVSGQTITDPFLQEELNRSWLRKDALYDQLTSAHHPEATTTVSPPPATETAPSPPPEQESPSASPQSQAPPAPVPALPTTFPEFAIQPPASRPISQRPPIKPDIPPITGLTDPQIGRGITSGVDYMLGRFSGPELANLGSYEHAEGLDTLVVYALMQAGFATHDKRLDIQGPFMTSAIDAMKKFPMSTDYITYARALRATALALYDRPQDHQTIREDVQWLLQAQEHAEFTYDNTFARGTNFPFWDNSNTQYGLLGIWSGAEVGIQVPLEFWRDVRAHWAKYQLADGEWSYRSDQTNPSRSMTLAGIASLFVAQDYLDAQEYGEQVGRPPFSPALDKALSWLETEDNSVIALPQSSDYYTYYTLYGLERTGLASGFKFYGAHDWYRELAAGILAVQNGNGHWGNDDDSFDTLVDTSFALLFLARGRHPILMNKLRYDGDWANRPRDVANLARFASAELERPLNWQVVPLDHDWRDWTDSPILFMAGDKPPKLTDNDRQKIKSYIENGGMLLTQADGGDPQFSQFVENLGERLFPQYHWIDLPPGSIVNSVSYHIIDPPPARAITNGSRILMMHWPSDVTKTWQLRQDRIGRSAFELGVNLALYAAGKSELKNRLESDSLAMPSSPPLAALKLAQVQYDGNWDPEPAAWPRARRWFRQQTSLDIDLHTVRMETLGDSKIPLAYLAGNQKLNLTSDQLQSVKKFVESGGVLLIDPCGSPDDFLRSIHDDLMLRIFPSAHMDPVEDTNPLVTASASGMTDVSHPEVRQYVRSYTDISDWRPSISREGNGAIIILPLDMISGLLGEDDWGIAGYQSEYALELMKNIMLWTWDGAPESTP